MENSMPVTTAEIIEKRQELEQMEKEYLRTTPNCNNTSCSWHSKKSSGNCSWSVLLEECDDYEPKGA
jgi:hypothetical protein